MLGVALPARLLTGGGLLEPELVLVLCLVPPGVFLLAARLPRRMLVATLAVTLAGSMLPVSLPRGAIGCGPITFATLDESWPSIVYLGVLVVFPSLALEGLHRVARRERSRVSG